MEDKKLTHIDADGNPSMVDVSEKKISRRVAKARAAVRLGSDLLNLINNNELITKKGPVFQTAIIAGVMGAKNTATLIPFCHPLAMEDCKIRITTSETHVYIHSETVVTGKTGVEMEALTAVTLAALTVYDMCKALSHDIVIEEITLMEKTGGKKDFKRQ